MENNQSNFGSGFGYQYGTNDTIDVYMNGKWMVFEYREESEIAENSKIFLQSHIKQSEES